MPMSSNNYVAPTWVNEGPPALDAAELQAMCDTIQENQGGVGMLQEGQTTLTEKIVSLTALMGEKAEIQYGNYIGTGIYGSNAKTSITFRFNPRFVFVIKEDVNQATAAGNLILWADGLSSVECNQPITYRYYSRIGNRLEWYADSAYDQLNEHSGEYYYIGIG